MEKGVIVDNHMVEENVIGSFKKWAFTIADAIEALENIPKEKRQLPFKVFDWN